MSSVWHAIGTAAHWLYAHLAAMGISAVLLAIYGVAMKFLGGRKAILEVDKLRLEIEHIKIDTQKLQLEVQKLNEEKEQHDSAKRIDGLSVRIFDCAREKKAKNRTSDAVTFTEQELSEQLKESRESIGRALRLLQGQHGQQRIRYEPGFETWVLDV